MIFVDSSYWIAQHLARDRRHTEAIAPGGWSTGAGRSSRRMPVVAESWTFLRRRVGHAVTMAWLDRILAAPRHQNRADRRGSRGGSAGVAPRPRRAPIFIRRCDELRPTRRLRISDVLAFDGDFAAAGFNELRPERHDSVPGFSQRPARSRDVGRGVWLCAGTRSWCLVSARHLVALRTAGLSTPPLTASRSRGNGRRIGARGRDRTARARYRGSHDEEALVGAWPCRADRRSSSVALPSSS